MRSLPLLVDPFRRLRLVLAALMNFHRFFLRVDLLLGTVLEGVCLVPRLATRWAGVSPENRTGAVPLLVPHWVAGVDTFWLAVILAEGAHFEVRLRFR